MIRVPSNEEVDTFFDMSRFQYQLSRNPHQQDLLPLGPESTLTAAQWAKIFLDECLLSCMNNEMYEILERICLLFLKKFGMDEETCYIVASYLPLGFQIEELNWQHNYVSENPAFRIETLLYGKVLSETVLTFSAYFPMETRVKAVSGIYESLNEDVTEGQYQRHILFEGSVTNAWKKFFK
jgi:hypothetical protein